MTDNLKRSKDVQEVLSTPPSKTIFTANFVIFFLFIIFLIVLYEIKLPVKVEINGQINAVSLVDNNMIVNIGLSKSLTSLKVNNFVKLTYDYRQEYLEFNGKVKTINNSKSQITVKLNSPFKAGSDQVLKLQNLFKSYSQVSIVAYTDTISSLTIFKLTLLRQLGSNKSTN